VVVVGNRSNLYSATATMDPYTASAMLSAEVSPSSGVGANSWSVCFGGPSLGPT
jgi:hypothetical protein